MNKAVLTVAAMAVLVGGSASYAKSVSKDSRPVEREFDRVSTNSRMDKSVQKFVEAQKKNNQKEFCGLTIKEGDSEIVPAIYMESFYDSYEKGMSMPEIAESVVRIYEEHKNPWPEGVDLSYNAVRKKIVFRVVNAEKNREMLKDIPYLMLSDLAVYFCCIVSKV